MPFLSWLLDTLEIFARLALFSVVTPRTTLVAGSRIESCERCLHSGAVEGEFESRLNSGHLSLCHVLVTAHQTKVLVQVFGGFRLSRCKEAGEESEEFRAGKILEQNGEFRADTDLKC